MMRVRPSRTSAILLPLAALLAMGSCAVQRHGPDHAIYCALGKSRDGFDIYCPKPVLNGGWPAPFAFDRPGISIEGKIAFPEDDFRLWPFIANVAFYQLLMAVLYGLVVRKKKYDMIDKVAAERAAKPDPDDVGGPSLCRYEELARRENRLRSQAHREHGTTEGE